MRKRRRRLDLCLSNELVDLIDFAAARLSVSRTHWLREAAIARLRADGIDPLQPGPYRRRRPRQQQRQQAQQQQAPEVAAS